MVYLQITSLTVTVINMVKKSTPEGNVLFNYDDKDRVTGIQAADYHYNYRYGSATGIYGNFLVHVNSCQANKPSCNGENFSDQGEMFSCNKENFSDHREILSCSRETFSGTGEPFSDHGETFSCNGENFSDHREILSCSRETFSGEYGVRYFVHHS